MTSGSNDGVRSVAPPAGDATAAMKPVRIAKTGFGRAIGLGMLTFAVLFGCLGGWMAVTKISGAVVAMGRVSIKGEAKTVQHLDGGIVSEIAIANGDVVTAGDKLVRLDDTLLRANLTIYRNRLSEALARRARLIAERDGKARIAWAAEQDQPFGIHPIEDVRASQQKLLDVRLASRSGQLAQLREKIAQYRNQIVGVDGLKAAKARQIALIERELAGLHKLYDAGNTTVTRVLRLEREKSRLLGEQAEHDAQRARIANLINETRIQIVQVDRELSEKVLSELRTTEQEINDLSQQYHATRDKLNRVVIRAPVTGMVHRLSIYTVGGVIAPGSAGHANRAERTGGRDRCAGGTAIYRRIARWADRYFTVFPRSMSGTCRPLTVRSNRFRHRRLLIARPVRAFTLCALGSQNVIWPKPAAGSGWCRVCWWRRLSSKQDRTVLDYISRPIVSQVRRAFRED